MRLKLLKCHFNVITAVYFVSAFTTLVAAYSAEDFDDSIRYHIEFAGSKADKLNETQIFKTVHNELYHCHFPTQKRNKGNPFEEIVEGHPSPIDALKPYIERSDCMIYETNYWKYQLCHGRHVVQYHFEDKNFKNKLEFTLGEWNSKMTEELEAAWQEHKKNPSKLEGNIIKIWNVKYPYFEMEYSGGTPCELVNKSRTTFVRYICLSKEKNEIYSIKEISTCKYEIVVSMPALCAVPRFNPIEEVHINCFDQSDKEQKPLDMLRQQLSSLQTSDDDIAQKKNDLDLRLDSFLISNFKLDVSDIPSAQDFLFGDMCPMKKIDDTFGYEFCFGGHVREHRKEGDEITQVMLGKFSIERQLKWIAENPDKRVLLSNPNTITHYYSNGSTCDESGGTYAVTVELICPWENRAQRNIFEINRTSKCEYQLKFESSIICTLKYYVDEDGIPDMEGIQELFQMVQTDKLSSEETNELM